MGFQHSKSLTKVWYKKRTVNQKCAFIKNPQFLPNHYETLSKEGTHEDLILTVSTVWPRLM